VDILPAADLSHYFVSDKIISRRDHDEIMRASTPQEAARLLLDRVAKELQSGNSMVLNKMLLIIEHHSIGAAKILSSELKKKLSTASCKDHKTNGNNQGQGWLSDYGALRKLILCGSLEAKSHT